MSSSVSVPQMIVEMVKGSLDKAVLGTGEDGLYGKIRQATFQVYYIDLIGNKHPYAVTRKEDDYYVLHRGHSASGKSLYDAAQASCDYWDSVSFG